MTEGSSAWPADDARSLQSKAARGALWTVVHLAVSLPLGLVVNIVVARYLGVADVGRLAILTLAVELTATVVNLGVINGVVQMGAKAQAAGRRDDVRALLSASQGFRLLVTLPALVLVVTIAALVGGLPFVGWAWVVVFGVVLPEVTQGAAACLGIENRTDRGAQLVLVTGLMAHAASLGVVAFEGSVWALWAARIMVMGVIPVAALALISTDYARAVLRPRSPRTFPPGFWHFALPMGAATAVGSLVASRTEVFVLAGFGQDVAAGLYALSFGLSVHIFALAQALVGPLLPALSALREVSAGHALAAFDRTVRTIAVVAGVLVSSVVPGVAVLVPVIYGPSFAAAGAVVLALGCIGGLNVLWGPLYAFTQSRLAGRPLLRATLLALVVDLIVVLAFARAFGVWAAVVASGLAALTQMVLLARAELTDLGVPVRSFVRSSAASWLAGPAAICGWLASAPVEALVGSAVQATIHPAVVGAVAATAVGAVVWVALVRLVGAALTIQDVAAVGRALPGRLRPVLAAGLRPVTARAPEPAEG